MHKNPAITSVPIHEIIANRWSGYAYDSEKPVTKENLMALIEAARWAPSCYGDQPWRYLIWRRDEDHETWQKAFDCLMPGNREWVKNAPVLMASVAYTKFSKNQKPNRWGAHDTGAASVSMAIQAVSMGMMVHQMGGFDPDALREAFNIPEDFTPMAMIAVGWPAPADTLEGSLNKRETAERKRDPIGEHFYEGEWGSAFAEATAD